LLDKALPKAKSGGGKDLLAISCDYRSDISINDIQGAVLPIVEGKTYTLFEEVTMPNSNFHTVGILYSDIVGYLAARIDTISNDIDLFENIPLDQLENNGKVKKLESSQEMINKIKQLDKYRIVVKPANN
jgi:hypothetical protein